MAKTVEVGHKYHAGPPHGSLKATVEVVSTTEQSVLLDQKAKVFVDTANDNTVEVKGVLVEVITSDWPLYEVGTQAVMRTRFIKAEIVEEVSAFEVPLPADSLSV